MEKFVLGLSSVLAIISMTSSYDHVHPPHRVPDTLFGKETILLDRNVTCDATPDGDFKFPSETWSCYNIRVDGIRIGISANERTAQLEGCSDDVGSRNNDLAALCRQLLEAHDINGSLWAVLIVKDIDCSSGGRLQDRAAFESMANRAFNWVFFEAGSGFVKTLRCMLQK